MKRAKIILALLLCGALFAGLAMPAYASAPDFAVTADKKMVATGESITLTAVNAPQAQAGQTMQYHWYFYYDAGYATKKLLGTSSDAVIQVQAPGRDVVISTYMGYPFSQQFKTWYWCVSEISVRARRVLRKRQRRGVGLL